MLKVLKKLFDTEYKELQRFTKIADEIETLDEDMQKLSDDEVLDHVLDVISSSHKSISEITIQEWNKIAKIVGLENYKELLNMDKDTYRKLSKKFHPDLQSDEAMKAYGEKMFKIIQNLYALKSAQ